MKEGTCPICNHIYSKSRYATKHHILPKQWYGGSGAIAELCVICHREFEKENPHDFVWSEKECWKRWLRFLLSKGITNRYKGIIYMDKRRR